MHCFGIPYEYCCCVVVAAVAAAAFTYPIGSNIPVQLD
jgi:hypothetical protein